MQRIEGRPVGAGARRHHALLKPVHDPQPFIGLVSARLIETGLDLRLHLRDGELHVVQIAHQQRAAALYRMHVAVDQPGHEHPPPEIHHLRFGAQEFGEPGIAAHVDDPARANGQRLLHAVMGIDGINETMPIGGVGRGGGCGRLRAAGGGQRQEPHHRRRTNSLKLHRVLLPSLP